MDFLGAGPGLGELPNLGANAYGFQCDAHKVAEYSRISVPMIQWVPQIVGLVFEVPWMRYKSMALAGWG